MSSVTHKYALGCYRQLADRFGGVLGLGQGADHGPTVGRGVDYPLEEGVGNSPDSHDGQVSGTNGLSEESWTAGSSGRSLRCRVEDGAKTQVIDTRYDGRRALNLFDGVSTQTNYRVRSED